MNHFGLAEVYKRGIKKEMPHRCRFKVLYWAWRRHMGGSGVMEWCEEVPLCLWVMFQFLHLAVLCFQPLRCNKDLSKQSWRVRGVRRRRLSLSECFLGIVKERKRGRFGKKKDHKVWKSSSFSPLAEEDIWRTGVRASCGGTSKSIGNCSLYRWFRSITAQRGGRGHAQTWTPKSKDW